MSFEQSSVSDAPLVSIIILNYNKAQLTIECLESIWEHTAHVPFEVIVIDNGSTPEEFQKLKNYSGRHHLVGLQVNRFFGEGNNIGAEMARGKFLVFMNNDVTVTSHWLEPLLHAFQKYPDCGAAGPKFVYPNGMLQEAGALLRNDGANVQIGKFQDPSLPRFNQERVADYCSAATLMIKKNLFERVLGFDRNFEPAYYEDVDLCLKIGQLGLKVYYIPDSSVVHHENATTSDPRLGVRLTHLVGENREKFVHRWKPFLETGEHLPAPLEERTPNDRPVSLDSVHSARRMAIATERVLTLDDSSTYLLHVADALIAHGYETWLLTPERYSHLRVRQLALELQLDLHRLKLARLDDPLNPKDLHLILRISENSKIPEITADLPLPLLPVEMPTTLPPKKVGSIVSIGEFFRDPALEWEKSLLQTFRALQAIHPSLELHLIGVGLSNASHRENFVRCRELASGLPVMCYSNPSLSQINELLGSATLYWQAPLSSEADTYLLRAMSAEAIPLRFRPSQTPESGEETLELSETSWNTPQQLEGSTLKLLSLSASSRSHLGGLARKSLEHRTRETFRRNWGDVLNRIGLGAS